MFMKALTWRFMPKKLSQKLILSFTIIMSCVGAVASYVHVVTQERQLLEAMMIGADQLSGSITSATWHAMLADKRGDAYQTMQTIAQKQGISRIRIFNKEGRIMYSTAEADSGGVDKYGEACYMCHSALQPLVKVDVPSRVRVFTSPDGRRKLGMITPIYNEASCSNAECHSHPASMTVLGVLDVTLTLDRVDAQMQALRGRVVLITTCIVLLMSLFIIYFTKRVIESPIRQLIVGTRAVSAMQLDTPVTIHSSEELDELAASFETMRLRLKEALGEINRFTQSLESKVKERSEQLSVAQLKLLQSDRLASLGQLSASVAHEINNPLSGVLNLSMLMQRIVKEDGIPKERIPEFRRYLGQVVNETSRVGRIVQDLLAFSRRSKPQRSRNDFNAIVVTTVNLVGHKLRLMNVAVDLDLDKAIPPINCDGSQLQQVVINLLMNGAEASQNKPDARVRLRTFLEGDGRELVFEVADNGEGIPDEHRGKIFDPFFTTKGDGKGVGLGLAVVYGIIDSHKGDIEVKSVVGAGTTFTVRLPVDSVPAQIATEHPA